MKNIYDVTEQDEIEMGLCWCGKGYNGHNQDHLGVVDPIDRTYLLLRDSWGKKEPLMETAAHIWKVSRYYD